LREADIVSTATTSATPVFRDADLKAGVHINAIGSYKPHIRELPGETVGRARLFVDDRRAALEEAGDILIPLREGLIGEGHIRGEIGEVLAGLKPGRTADDETTVFKSVGNAVEDLAVAALVLG
jgi:ornithine cyclodeaminase/alanine dehydrogenase-like protein (mu-crystallin family)